MHFVKLRKIRYQQQALQASYKHLGQFDDI